MQWSDDGLVLRVRPHGESAAIVTLLTEHHGRHAGLVRGGQSNRHRAMLQPGAIVHATWRGRLQEHLGNYGLEPVKSLDGIFFDDPLRLAALQAIAGVIDAALPEREPMPGVLAATQSWLDVVADPDHESDFWMAAYIHWEIGMLRVLGFGLDLSVCAATGINDGLIYVSPRSGRAVSASAGEPYRDRLLALPAFLVQGGLPDARQVVDGLTLTGFFLERFALAQTHQPLPDVRAQLLDRYRRWATKSGRL